MERLKKKSTASRSSKMHLWSRPRACPRILLGKVSIILEWECWGSWGGGTYFSYTLGERVKEMRKLIFQWKFILVETIKTIFFNRHWNIFLQLQTVTQSAGYFLLERAFKYTCCKLCLEQLTVTETICQYVLIRIGNQRITLKIISCSVVKATVVRSVDWSPVKVITVSLPPLLLNFLSWSNALNESLGFISALTLLLYIASFDSYANTILHHV